MQGSQFGFISVWRLPMDRNWFLPKAVLAYAQRLADSSLTLLFLNALLSPKFKDQTSTFCPAEITSFGQYMFQGQYKQSNDLERFFIISFTQHCTITHGTSKNRETAFPIDFVCSEHSAVLLQKQIYIPTHPVVFLETQQPSVLLTSSFRGGWHAGGSSLSACVLLTSFMFCHEKNLASKNINLYF